MNLNMNSLRKRNKTTIVAFLSLLLVLAPTFSSSEKQYEQQRQRQTQHQGVRSRQRQGRDRLENVITEPKTATATTKVRRENFNSQRRRLSVSKMQSTIAQHYSDNPNVGSPKNLLYTPTHHYTNPQHQLGNEDDNNENSYNKPRFHSYFVERKSGHKENRDNASTDTDNIFDPKLAWLASFPNSGTSFTLGLVARATNTTFATNYGIEANFGNLEVPSLPIYPHHPEGPYMPDPLTSFHHRKLPHGHYVLTKTHCGGYCVNCNPKMYAYGYKEYQNDDESMDKGNHNANNTADSHDYDPPNGISFLQDCSSGIAVDDMGNLVGVKYPPERVHRIIHLIRNPFHNVIARFHLERKHHADANTTSDREWLESHPDNQEGMSKFCDEQNQNRWKAESKFFESDYFFPVEGEPEDTRQSKTTFSRRNGDRRSPTQAGMPWERKITPDQWKELTEKVPCRADFFRYIQWHNLFHQSLDYLPGTPRPVLTLYYEGFEEPSYDQTATAVLDFLDLKPVPDVHGNIKWNEFHSRSDYGEFFSDDQKLLVRKFLHTIASFQVWGETEHYFQPA